MLTFKYNKKNNIKILTKVPVVCVHCRLCVYNVGCVCTIQTVCTIQAVPVCVQYRLYNAGCVYNTDCVCKIQTVCVKYRLCISCGVWVCVRACVCKI